MYGDFWHDDYEICFDRKVVSAVMSDSVIVSIGYYTPVWQRVYCSGGCVCYLCADFTSLLTYVPQGGLWSVQGVVLERPLRRAAVQQVRETHDAQGAAGREAALPELRLPVSTWFLHVRTLDLTAVALSSAWSFRHKDSGGGSWDSMLKVWA